MKVKIFVFVCHIAQKVFLILIFNSCRLGYAALSD